MSNTSATGGYLIPAAFSVNDDALADIMQGFIVGITGLTGKYVRPYPQPDMPIIPTNGTDWCAFTLGNWQAGNAYQEQGDTSLRFEQHETFDLSCSFYGAHCERYAALVRDSLQIGQNREALFLQGIAVNGGAQIVHAPELINEVWHDRCDIVIGMARQVDSEYAILSLLNARGTIESATPDITVNWSLDNQLYSPDLIAIFNAMIPPPSQKTRDAISKAFSGLSPYWSGFDRFGIMQGAEYQQHGLLDWKNPSKSITLHGAVTWTHSEGFIGSNFVVGHGATGFIPSVDGVNFTLNDASLFVYVGVGGTPTNTGNYIGANSGVSADLWYSDTGGNVGGFLNNESYTRADSYPTRPSNALLCFNRAGANDVKIYSDGVKISNFGETVAATALPSVEFWLGCMNGSGSEYYMTDAPIKMWACAGSFTDSEMIAIKAVIDQYFVDMQ